MGLDANLAAALAVGVPLRMQEIRGWTDEQRANDAAWVVELMRAGAAGDVLLYSGAEGQAAGAFAALVRGLAALAYVEGGVELAGLHWCAAPHIECPNGPQWAHLDGVDVVCVENEPLGSAASPQAAAPIVDGAANTDSGCVRPGGRGGAEPLAGPRYGFDADNGTRSPGVNVEPG